ncbi:hypothetical protein PISL3812_08737 [Talaromyces islandicus]|uniref:Cupin type-1 domain-containing protein n=1 Tax=Talaromyces islandicus TaxID=28573 RepID=A0A0U1M9U3_TALIS|nr:hypothetical protein PISL3812_08737 [Talaromyces islandicus]
MFSKTFYFSAILTVIGNIANAAPAAIASSNPQRGGSGLIGYSPSNTISNDNTETISYQLTPSQTQDADIGAYLDFSTIDNPQPIRGSLGGTDPGPRNLNYDRMNPDKLAPPGTDSGATINAQWPLGLSHTKLGKSGAGWSRQENTDVMPAASLMAGAVNDDGQTFIDDVGKGDVWFFPAGIPHSIQALDYGVEFMLVFDDGSFSEDNTFLASEIFAHNPKEVLSKDLGVPVSAFQDLPSPNLFIFPGTPAPKDIQDQNVTGSAGSIPKSESYSYHFSEQRAEELEGGSVKIIDPLSFPIAKDFSAALVTVKPGGLREIHWHPTSDEWTFFIQGQGRATVFTPPSDATTFDFMSGDVGYFPQSNSHYIENTGREELIFLEVLQADHFSGGSSLLFELNPKPRTNFDALKDVSLAQWVGSTSKQIIQDTLNLSNETLSKLSTEKKTVVL